MPFMFTEFFTNLVPIALYSSIKEMFYDIGAHLFIAVIIPSLAIILTVAMTQSIYKFIKEVTV
ncbi:MAG: hypothetical protein ACP5H8_00845 [Candidatus Micrarchaeia archaeon]